MLMLPLLPVMRTLVTSPKHTNRLQSDIIYQVGRLLYLHGRWAQARFFDI